MKIMSWILSIISAVFMLQTLYFKFTGAPESVQLFTTIHMEPWGRIGVGILELIASVCIIIPAARFWGALLGAGLMAGAIFFHATIIGIIDPSGSSMLFVYAVVTFLCCVILLVLNRRTVLRIVKKGTV